MIDKIEGLPSGCDGLRARGTVTRQDYQLVLEPVLQQAYREGRRLRFLYQFGPDFEGFTAGAAWEDLRVGLRYLRLFERCAIVTDIHWIRGTSRLMSVVLPCPLQIFGDQEWQRALSWLSSPVATSGLSHTLLPDVGVLLIEPHGPLRSEDFEAIAVTVDPWIELGGKLHGVIVRARHFPGWHDFGALLHHFRFIRDHERYVQRIALAVDGLTGEVVQKLTEHFVQADVRQFSYDQFDEALLWASIPGTTLPRKVEFDRASGDVAPR